MLPKSYRLNLNKQFDWVVNGRKIDTTSFRLFLRLGGNLRPLVGIAMSSKYFRNSSKRHQAKRLTSRVVEGFYSNLSNSLNLVIMPKSTIFGQSTGQLTKELKDVKELFATD